VGLEGTHLNVMKTIYDRPTANIIVVKAKSFSSKIKNKQGCPLLPFLFNIVLKILVAAIRQEKEKAFRLVRNKYNCPYLQMA